MLARKILNLEKQYDAILEKARKEAEKTIENAKADALRAESIDFSQRRQEDEAAREEIAKDIENDVQEFRVKDELVEEIVKGVNDL